MAKYERLFKIGSPALNNESNWSIKHIEYQRAQEAVGISGARSLSRGFTHLNPLVLLNDP